MSHLLVRALQNLYFRRRNIAPLHIRLILLGHTIFCTFNRKHLNVNYRLYFVIILKKCLFEIEKANV